MAEPKKCPSCGAELPAHVAGGHCLACLLKLGLEAGQSDVVQSKPGDRIDRYLLLEKIGEGGCGVVFLAQQEEPVKRQVALKVIKPNTGAHDVIARFEAERQMLALLEHPNIAKIFDAGETQSGQPFFVMELVRGVKITEYCDREKLSMQQRIELFIPVCQAVQHAHQKGIVHRDLKPSNILVTPGVDGALGAPRIIDLASPHQSARARGMKTCRTPFSNSLERPPI